MDCCSCSFIISFVNAIALAALLAISENMPQIEFPPTNDYQNTKTSFPTMPPAPPSSLAYYTDNANTTLQAQLNSITKIHSHKTLHDLTSIAQQSSNYLRLKPLQNFANPIYVLVDHDPHYYWVSSAASRCFLRCRYHVQNTCARGVAGC